MSARLEKIQRDFLWGGGALENRPSWKIICAAKNDGGLGIRSLAAFNKALLGSGCGDLLMRMTPYGSKLSLESTAFKRGGGAPKVKRPLWCGGLEGHHKWLGEH